MSYIIFLKRRNKLICKIQSRIKIENFAVKNDIVVIFETLYEKYLLCVLFYVNELKVT